MIYYCNGDENLSWGALKLQGLLPLTAAFSLLKKTALQRQELQSYRPVVASERD